MREAESRRSMDDRSIDDAEPLTEDLTKLSTGYDDPYRGFADVAVCLRAGGKSPVETEKAFDAFVRELQELVNAHEAIELVSELDALICLSATLQARVDLHGDIGVELHLADAAQRAFAEHEAASAKDYQRRYGITDEKREE